MPQSRGMEEDDAALLRAYYERGMVRERLSDGRGDLEFTPTTEIVLRPMGSMSWRRSPVTRLRITCISAMSARFRGSGL